MSPREASSAILMPGLGYTKALTEYIIQDAAQSEIVKAQLADPDVDVFSGTPFASEDLRQAPDLGSLFTVDKNAIASSFGMNITQQGFGELLQKSMNEIMSALQVDTTAARVDFVNTLRDLGTYMFQSAVESGGGTITLSDADAMASDAVYGGFGAEKITAMAKKYKLEESVLQNVYQPLLVGMVADLISSQPAPTLYTMPQGLQADPQPIMAAGLNNSGPGPRVVLLSDTFPEEVPEQTDPIPQWSEPAVQPEVPEPQESIPQESVPGESQPQESIPQESVPGESQPEESLPDLPLTPEDFAVTIDKEMIGPAVSSFCQSAMVQETAAVVAQKMMQATAMETLTAKVAGLSDVFTGFIRDSFFVDTQKLSGAFQMNIDEEKIQRLFEALSSGTQARSARSNLRKLGYADLQSPSTMNVYMKDFDTKEEFVKFIEDYNQSMLDADQEGKVIRYTDMTGQMMDSVRIIINSVSYVLIAFVSVSLIVSSIMIGIITYISVMERTREIGVLRAMGASKHNISQVFNAETFIIGLCSGVIGIGVTLGLLIPINRLLHHLTGNVQIVAVLPWAGAVILIILSMLLTLLGGLIPSRQAAKKDPVIALRSE